jgi:hypothetical protein
MAIAFQETFPEILYRVLARCLSGAAMPRTYRRDQILSWLRRRMEKAQ